MNFNFTYLKNYVPLLLLLIAANAVAQLTGTKTIPGDYTDFTSAINDLNTQGVGSGGVTFDVAAGYSETSVLPTITVSGTSSNPIIFQKSGVGANPILYAGAGTGTLDGIIRLEGADYITFNGIDVSESAANTNSTSQAEWGYALLKASATNGCHYITITNCNITLNRSNTSSVGIYAANHTPLSSTSLNLTAASGSNSYNQFTNNSINGGYIGIRVAGYISSSPYTLYDQQNRIGGSIGNSITNFGGGSSTGYGIYSIYQNRIEVGNNTLSGGAASHTTTLYGINLSTGTNSDVDIYYNNISLVSGSTSSSTYAISNSMGSTSTSNNQVNIYNNVVKSLSWPTATTGAFYGVYSSATCYNINMYNNSVNTNAKGGSGNFFAVYNSGSVVNKALIYNNQVFDNPMTSTGIFYGIYSNPGTTTNSDVYNNLVYNNTNGGTFYGLSTSTGNITNFFSNLVYGNSTSGNTMTGMNIASGTNVNIFKNKFYDLTSTGSTSITSGIQTNAGTTYNISNNLIGGLKAPNSSSLNAVIGLNFAAGTTTNAYYNTVFLDATSTGTNFGSSAVYASATPTVDLRNNIFVNLSTPNGTGITAAHRRGTTILTDFANSSNNNLYYAGTPSASRVIFYDGTNSDQSLAAYKARVAPRETLSITENPLFLSTTGSSPDFLHITPTVTTGIESGAVAITGFSHDYDALNIRTGYPLAAQVNGGGTAPDIGADEGDFTPVSMDIGADLLLSPVSGTCHPAPDSVTIRIKNYSSITLDFSVNPVTVNAAVSGISPVTFTPVVLSSGSLAGGATMNVTVSNSYNMSAAGNYTFTASTSVTGDGNATNDAMSPVSISISGGTATASASSVCGGSSSTLSVTGNSGAIQWQRYDEMTSSWVNETGTGNTSATYVVTPSDTSVYRALTCGVHPSTTDTVNVIIVNPAVTTGASRCGTGPVTLTASGAPVLNWYTAATGGSPVNVGSSYTPTISSTTTYYVESFAPSSSGNPVKITEADLGTNDAIEIQNLSPTAVNTAGWVVALSNSYTNINSVNTIVWNLPATMQPGEVLFKTDQSSSTNYWGNNIFWNPGAYPSFAGWVLILDNNGNIVDFAAWGWLASDLPTLNVTINGFPVTVGQSWTGNGIVSTPATTGLSIARQGNSDTNTASDFGIISSTIGTQNPGLSYPWGCVASARTAVTATVNPVPTATATSTDITCNGAANGTADVTVTSGTSPYSYTWNNSATTASITTLSQGTYTVIVTDAAGCSDTVNAVVNEPAALSSTVTVTNECGTNANGSATAVTTGGTGTYTYDWNVTPSQTTATATTLSAGTYTLTITDANLCTYTTSVTINSNPIPNVIATNDTSVCSGSSLMLSASGADTYVWDNSIGSGASVSVSPVTNTTYIVTGTANGCSSTDTVDVTVNPLPVAGFTSSGSPTVTFASTSSNAVTFNWNFGDGSPVETVSNPTHQYLADGTYTVTLVVSNSCSSDTISNQVVIIGTGISSLQTSSVMLAPNPTEGAFTLTFGNEENDNVMIRILDAHGKLVYLETIADRGTIIKKEIDLSREAKGVYYLHVTTSKNTFTKHVIIR